MKLYGTPHGIRHLLASMFLLGLALGLARLVVPFDEAHGVRLDRELLCNVMRCATVWLSSLTLRVSPPCPRRDAGGNWQTRRGLLPWPRHGRPWGRVGGDGARRGIGRGDYKMSFLA
jgi:hypothetical protein